MSIMLALAGHAVVSVVHDGAAAAGEELLKALHTTSPDSTNVQRFIKPPEGALVRIAAQHNNVGTRRAHSQAPSDLAPRNTAIMRSVPSTAAVSTSRRGTPSRHAPNNAHD